MRTLRAYNAARFAIRPLAVAKLLSQLFGVMAVIVLVPATVAMFGASLKTTLSYFGVCALLLVLFGLGRLLPMPSLVQRSEAMATVALLFIFSSVLLCLPIMTLGVPFIDAWFEAVSGITTTGLSVMAIEEKPWAFLFNRGWMQWVGGLGVVVLALSLSVFPGAIGHRLGFSDAETGDAVGGTRAHAKRIIIVYLLLTAVGIGLLSLEGASFLDAVVHTMAAVSTGGFSNHADSLAALSTYHVSIVSALCVAGAVSFHIYYLATFLPNHQRRLDNQFYSLLAALAGLSVLAIWLAWLQNSELTWWQMTTMIISAQTTAGFSTIGLADVPYWFLLLLCAAMFVGGGIGSTSGGIKLGRALFIFEQARLHLIRSSAPERLFVSSRASHSEEVLRDTLAVVAWFVVVLFASWLVFLLHGFPPLESLFEVISALSTAGLSSGLTNTDLPVLLKVVLCIDMLFGRVEIVAMLILFMPRSWIGRRRKLA